jgi:hypothetical protein
MYKNHFMLFALVFAVTTSYAANPVSKEWVMQQISTNIATLTAADWNAICTSGSPASSTGCYGSVNSAGFLKISNNIGGFIRYANINPVNVPNSVYVKAFLGGTNTPISTSTIAVNVISSAARCVVLTQEGFGIGPGGVNASSPGNGTDTGAFTPPSSLVILTINNENTTLPYNQASFAATNVGGPPSSDPIYLLCAGYNATDGTTATATTVTAS